MCTVCQPDVGTEARPDSGPLPPFDRAAVKADWLRHNAAQVNPLPVCEKCGYPTHSEDMDWFFHGRLCNSCAVRLADRLLYRIARKHGRKRAWKLIKRLSK